MKRPTYAADVFFDLRNQHKQEFLNGDNRIIECIPTERVSSTGGYSFFSFYITTNKSQREKYSSNNAPKNQLVVAWLNKMLT